MSYFKNIKDHTEEKLLLSKSEMLEIVEKARKDIDTSNKGIIDKIKINLGLRGVKLLISKNDQDTNNYIWNKIIEFSDDLRYKNAKRTDLLKKLSEIKKKSIIDKK